MELLSFTTEQIRVTIRGNPGSRLFHNSGEAADASIHVFAQDQGELTYQDGNKEANAIIQPKQRLFITTQPLFYEYQSYEMIIENEAGKVLEFWHQSPLIRDKIRPLGRSGKLYTGVVNFAGEIGYSDFEILLDGKPYLKFTIEIFPTKINYRKDYNELMMDITNEVYELAFDFIKRTYQGASLNQKQNKDATVFYSILRQLYDPFIQALDQLMLRPHHQLHKVSEVVPANKVKRTNRDTIKWLRKNQREIIKKDGGYCINRALTVKKEITHDTNENRFVKFIVSSIRQRILNVKNHYEKLARVTDSALMDTFQGMIRGIDARLHTDFLNQVGEFDSRSSMSLVFLIAPAYRSLYHYYLMLNQGLNLTGDLFQISTKDLPALYEYWCFIKLNAILKTKYELKAQSIIKVNKNRLFVTLKKGAESRVRYLNRHNGEELILAYNPKSHALPTVTQKPDNVLTLKKKKTAWPINISLMPNTASIPPCLEAPTSRFIKIPAPKKMTSTSCTAIVMPWCMKPPAATNTSKGCLGPTSSFLIITRLNTSTTVFTRVLRRLISAGCPFYHRQLAWWQNNWPSSSMNPQNQPLIERSCRLALRAN